MEPIRVDDDRFGAIEVVLERGARCEVRGEGIPTTVVRHLDGASRASAVAPIGTRDGARLEAHVGGAPVLLTPGPARVMRGSYRVRADVGGERLLLTPCSPHESRLVRGWRYRGSNQLGVYRSFDGELDCIWDETVVLGRRAFEAIEATPLEASLGYALAASFGTGASFAFMAMLEGVGLATP